MYRRLRHTQRRLLSLRHWRIRLVFWLGALLLGASAAGFALIAAFADKSFHRLAHSLPYTVLLLPPLGLVAVAFLIYAGILMVTAGGAEEQVTKARKIIMYAVIGIVIILLSYTIVTFVTSALG